jgi:hypothetical protein
MCVFTNPAAGSVKHAKAYTAAILDLLGDRDPSLCCVKLPPP